MTVGLKDFYVNTPMDENEEEEKERTRVTLRRPKLLSREWAKTLKRSLQGNNQKKGGEAERIDVLYHLIIFQMRTVYLDCKSIKERGILHLSVQGIPRKLTSICAFIMQQITDVKHSGSRPCRQGIAN